MLTSTDIDTLIEAIDIWETSANQDALVTEMLTVMLVPDKEAYDTLKGDREARLAKAKEETQQRKQQGVLLKAKLFQLRNHLSEDNAYARV